MHITLYRKYRPKNFSEISGENEIIKSLTTSLKNNSIAHAYIFSGPRGLGKTSTARLIAKGVNCLNLNENGEPCNSCKNCLEINEGYFIDLIEIDAASNRSIDEIRALKEKINYQPVSGKKKVYIIDEAHMLTKEACNALLKTLEEPPEHVIFILATTELDKILPTIISRCQRYDFKPLTLNEMKERLNYICAQENVKISEEVFPIIYDNSAGSMRDAISILERLIISSNGNFIDTKISEDSLGITPAVQIKLFLDRLLSFEEHSLIEQLEELSRESYDIELFFKDLAKYCKNLMLKKELETNIGFVIISEIYDIITKFKFEEDKKLIGYVIVAEIILKLSSHKKVEPTTYIAKEIKTENTLVVENPKKLNLDLDTIKREWHNLLEVSSKTRMSYKVFLMNATPSSLDGNTLKISYEETYKYMKEQMEAQDYYNEFEKIVKQFFNEESITIEFILTHNNSIKKEPDFHKKIQDFFEGKEI